VLVPPLEDPPLDEPPLLLVDPLLDPPLLLLDVEPLLLLVAPLLELLLVPASFVSCFGAGGFDSGSFWLSCSGSALFTLLVVPPEYSSTGASAHAPMAATRAMPDVMTASLSEIPPETSDR
jgi:hypothetical protein